MANIVIPSELNYTIPPQPLETSQNFVSFQPVSGSEFSPSSTIKFRLQSGTAFLNCAKSFLKYDLIITGGTQAATSANTITEAGWASGVIDRIEEIVGGERISDIDSYGLYANKINTMATDERKNMLKTLEGVGDHTRGSFLNQATVVSRTVCHSLQTPLFNSAVLLPLPFIKGGIELNVYTNSFVQFMDTVSAAAPPTSYKITNVSFVACVNEVPSSYMTSYAESLKNGGSARIPIKALRHYISTTTATSQHNFQLNVGFLKSLTSVLGIQRLAASIGANTHDTFNECTRDDLKEYFISVGTNRYPRDFAVPTAVARYDPTSVMMTLNSIDGKYSHLKYDHDAFNANTNFAIYHDFTSSPSGFADGIRVADGSIVMNLAYTTAATASSRWDWFVSFDSILVISNLGVSLLESDW